MDVNETKKIIAEKLNEGIGLSDIQKILADEYEVKMTFLELRLMASELENIQWEKPEEPKEEKEEVEEEEEEVVEAEPVGGTVVEISRLTRPGVALHGSVKFASGPTAEWVLDSRGQLGLDKLTGGEPTEEDIQEFQQELQKAAAGGRR
jgi:hypothetical protein